MGVSVFRVFYIDATHRIFYLEKYQQCVLQQCIFHYRHMFADFTTHCKSDDSLEYTIAKHIDTRVFTSNHSIFHLQVFHISHTICPK